MITRGYVLHVLIADVEVQKVGIQKHYFLLKAPEISSLPFNGGQ